jgi:hypothetical protein
MPTLFISVALGAQILKEFGIHPNPNYMFTLVQQLVQQLATRKTNSFKLAINP